MNVSRVFAWEGNMRMRGLTDVGRHRGIVIGVLAAAVLVGGAGVAAAGVSDGNYRPARQGCTGHADDAHTLNSDGTESDNGQSTEPGCQNLTFNVSDGNGTEALRAGTYQTPDGTSISPSDAAVTPGSAGDP